jgi:hypothetical protein
MILGVDFDNTIVRYDELFHRIAVERGFIPKSLPARKKEVRDFLRRQGHEQTWTELQGHRRSIASALYHQSQDTRCSRRAGLRFAANRA